MQLTSKTLDKAVDKSSFCEFLTHLKNAWDQNINIPVGIKQQGPIIVLDNLASHVYNEKIEQISHFFLPPYSPFLNLAEPINRDHKLGIRKLLRHFHQIPGYLEKLNWGIKKASSSHILQIIAHMGWNAIPNNYPQEHWKHIILNYFPSCLHSEEIHF